MNKLLTSVLLLFASCAAETTQTTENDNFYFPLKNFFTETTYCFVNQNDTAEKAYWKMQSTVSDNDTLFQTSIYNGENRISEIMVEKVRNGNAKIHSYVLYQYDEEGNKLSAECKILDSWVFKTSQASGEQIQWKISFKDPVSGDICELSKVRKLQNHSGEQKTFNDTIKLEAKKNKFEYKYSVISVYKKDKGLVSYKLFLPTGKVKDFIISKMQ